MGTVIADTMPEEVGNVGMDFFSSILPQLPYYLTRKDIAKFFGSIISPRYLANLDSKGLGPTHKRLGRKVVYKATDFVAWLASRIKR